jgi:predicted ATPase
VDVGNDAEPKLWTYRLVLQYHPRVRGSPVTVEEEVVFQRGIEADSQRRLPSSTDWLLYSQTLLQQVQRNQRFRDLVEFFGSIRYLHVVPQVVRDARRGILGGEDPFGGDLLRRMKETPKKLRDARLKRIAAALAVAVPQFEKLRLDDDAEGRPHLYADFRHWRVNPTAQNEEVLSDGTLRLLGFLWSITERGGPLLLEEPELSLHDAVVAQLPMMISRAQRLSGRQVIASTHSAVIIGAPGVGLHEIHRLEVTENGSRIETAGSNPIIKAQVETAGWTAAQAVLPLTQPDRPDRLSALALVSD